MSRRIPSISTSEVECPIQVMRKPERGLVAKIPVSVWNGPSECFGDRAAVPKKKRGPILNIRESPPTFVGTGFTYFLPSRLAGIRVMPIGWFMSQVDSVIRIWPVLEAVTDLA